jgi:hypothetical protein
MKIAAFALTGLAIVGLPTYFILKQLNKKKNDIVDPWRGIIQF